MAQTVKNPLAMQETWVRSLGWEDLLEEDMAVHSFIAWRNVTLLLIHSVSTMRPGRSLTYDCVVAHCVKGTYREDT